MSAEQYNYEAAVSAFSKQLNALSDVLWASSAPIPREVAIELQHMLLHLLLASQASPADYSTRRSQLGHALGHLDRAMLDACKILISKNFCNLSQNITFMREWIDLRQCEGKNHFREQSSFSNITCDKYYEFLKKYSLISGEEAAAANPSASRTQGDKWKAYFTELDRWFKRELLYSSLCGQKSLDALNEMLQSFWTLDAGKLCALNKRLELDILVTNAEQALKFGWNGKNVLQDHKDFITQYIEGQCDEAKIMQNHSSWVHRAFTSFLSFYGQVWDD